MKLKERDKLHSKLYPLKFLFHIISILFGIGLIVGIGYYIGIHEFLIELKKIQIIALIPLIIVYSFSWFFRAARLKKIIKIFKKDIGLLDSLCVEVLGNFANFIFPAKLGDVSKIIYLKKRKDLSYKQATFSALLVRIMDLMAVAFLTLLSALFISRKIILNFSFYIALVISVFAIIFLFTLIFYLKPSIYFFLFIGPLKKLLPTLKRLRELMINNFFSLVAVYGISLLVWVFDVLTLYIFFVMYEIKLSITAIAFVLFLSNLVKTIPITPNGIGFYEGIMVVLLVAFGVTQSTAFTVALLDHGFMNLYTLMLGFYALYKLKINIININKETFQKSARP